MCVCLLFAITALTKKWADLHALASAAVQITKLFRRTAKGSRVFKTISTAIYVEDILLMHIRSITIVELQSVKIGRYRKYFERCVLIPHVSLQLRNAFRVRVCILMYSLLILHVFIV